MNSICDIKIKLHGVVDMASDPSWYVSRHYRIGIVVHVFIGKNRYILTYSPMDDDDDQPTDTVALNSGVRDDKSELRDRFDSVDKNGDFVDGKSNPNYLHIEALACTIAQEAYDEEFVRRQDVREAEEAFQPCLL